MPKRYLVAACLFTFLIAGCDLGGEYEKKQQASLQTAVKTAEVQAKSAGLDEKLHAAYTEVTDAARKPVGVRIRLPKIFDGNSKAVTQNPIVGMDKLGGGAYTLVRVVDGPSGQKHSYLVMLTAVPKGNEKNATSDFAKGLASTMPGAKSEDATFTSPTGQSVNFKRLKVEMSQAIPGAQGKLDARLDIFQIDAGNNLVLIVWMTPNSLAATLDPALEASMGSVQISSGDVAQPGAKAAPGCF